MEVKPISAGNTQETKRKKGEKNIKETLAALAVSQTAPLISLPVGVLASNKLVGVSKSLNASQTNLVNEAVDTILYASGLTGKGVKIIDQTASTTITKPTPILNKLYEFIDPIYATKRGKNAFYIDKGKGLLKNNSINVNRSKLPLATFHEMGHAHNFNFSKIGKMLQKMRMPGMITASALAVFVACSKESKPKEGQELTKAQKAKNTLRKTSPLLAILAMVPTVIEEGMATFKGNKWAKSALSPDLAKKVTKGNAWGLASYIATSIGLALATLITKKVKDSLVEKKENLKIV